MSPILKESLLNWTASKISQLDQSVNTDQLYPSFRDRMNGMLAELNGKKRLEVKEGLDYRSLLRDPDLPTVYVPVLTTVGPRNQAYRYVKGRLSRDVDHDIQHVTRMGGSLIGRWLMDAKVSVSGNTAATLTKFLPGDSWHQWGIECDVVPFVWRGSRRVQPESGPAGLYYKRIAKLVEDWGMFCNEGPVRHIRYVSEEKASMCFSWAEIQRYLLRRYEFTAVVSDQIGTGYCVAEFKRENKKEMVNVQ